MPNIKAQCKTIRDTFTEVLVHNPLAAVLRLGSLYRSLETAKDKDKTLLQQTLSEVKSKLQPDHVQRLWDAITKLDPHRYNVMSKANKETLNSLKHHVLQDFELFKHLNVTSIIEIGQDIEFYREALIAIIRKHLDENHELDPFNTNPINYSLLKEGGPEQNSRYLGTFVKECSSLPIENLVLLGSSPELANFILLDLNDVATHLDLSKRFSELHPSLRKEVANVIQNQINTLPLSPQEATFCQVELPKLQGQFPEFQAVTTDTRVRRNNQVVPQNSGKKLLRQISEGAFGGTVLSYVLPAALAPAGFVFTVPAILVTVPLGIGYSLSLNHLLNASKKSVTSLVTESISPTAPRPT